MANETIHDRQTILTELFRRRRFEAFCTVNGKVHEKQMEALKILTDDETTEFGYGGAAGGAKSWTGCIWVIMSAKAYSQTRWFIGREELKRLRESTLITFFKVCRAYGITGWKYNGQDHYIQFDNGSRIDLLDLKMLPSDALYERYGSIEYTGGWIEEGGEVNVGAYDTLKSRIGRQNNEKYNLLPKLFVTLNPKKNWCYTTFWKPFKNKCLPKFRKFLQALVQHNPHGDKFYLAQLQSITDKVRKQRLYFGNFDYDDDPTTLVDFDAITDAFTNDFVKPDGLTYGSADLAMKGRDKFIAGSWKGMICTVKIDKPIADGKIIETDLKNMMVEDCIPHSHMVVDSDGMGSYLESYLTGIKEFHGGGRAFDPIEYANLKSECGYKLAEVFNKRQIKIICTPEQQEKIAEEIGVLKADDIDGDEKKKRIIKKDVMKELLGRSPDYLDMLLMKMLFHIKKPFVLTPQED